MKIRAPFRSIAVNLALLLSFCKVLALDEATPFIDAVKQLHGFLRDKPDGIGMYAKLVTFDHSYTEYFARKFEKEDLFTHYKHLDKGRRAYFVSTLEKSLTTLHHWIELILNRSMQESLRDAELKASSSQGLDRPLDERLRRLSSAYTNLDNLLHRVKNQP